MALRVMVTQSPPQVESAILRRMLEISIQLLGQLELQPLLQSIATGVIEILNANSGGIYIYDQSRQELVPVVPVMQPKEALYTLKPGEGLAGKVMQSGKPMRVDNYDEWEGRAAKQQRGTVGPVVQAPVKRGSEFLGVVYAERTVGAPAFTDQDAEHMLLFANYAAIAISNAKLYEQAKLSAEELAGLYDTSLEMAAQLDVTQLLERIIERSKKIVHGQYGQFYRYNQAEDILVAAFPGLFPSNLTGRMQLGEGLSGKVFLSRKPLVIDDYDNWEGRATGTPKGLFTRTIGVPVMHGNKILGVLALSRSEGEPAFNPDELRLLTLFANQAAAALANAQQFAELNQLHEQLREKERLESELHVAQEIQASLFPREIPKVRGWDIAALWNAAQLISGDFYDLFPLPGDKWGFVIADVAGKGVPAALYMALCRTLTRTMCMDGRPPSAAISRVNDLILADTYSEWFVTLFYGALDPRWGIFNFVNAGHCKPILYRAATNKLEFLYTNGMALGVEPGIELAEKSVRFDPGDMLLMYTDGITEAQDVHDEFFGERRIRAILKKMAGQSPREILDELQRSVVNFSRGRRTSDDATAILIKRKE